MKNALITSILLLGLASVKADHDPFITCQENVECELKQGSGACCLHIATSNFYQQKCRSASFVNYYTKTPSYNPKTKIWTNPQDASITNKIYCVDELQPREVESMPLYPYNQTWMDDSFILKRDPVNKNRQTNQFYYPKQVTSFDDEMELFGTMVLYGWFGFWSWPFLWISQSTTLWGIFIGFCIDIFSGNPAMWSAYPNLYDNFVT